MAERTTDRERLAAKIATLNDVEVSELLEYTTVMDALRAERDAPTVFEDELVSLLANSRESLRARAVFEWDRARRRAERAGAHAPSAAATAAAAAARGHHA